MKPYGSMKLSIEEQRQIIDECAKEIVQKVKKLPTNYVKCAGQIPQRTVWLEFVSLVRNARVSPTRVVLEMCKDAAHAIDFVDREDMWFEAKQIPVDDRCGVFPSDAACLSAVTEMIYAKVVNIATR